MNYFLYFPLAGWYSSGGAAQSFYRVSFRAAFGIPTRPKAKCGVSSSSILFIIFYFRPLMELYINPFDNDGEEVTAHIFIEHLTTSRAEHGSSAGSETTSYRRRRKGRHTHGGAHSTSSRSTSGWSASQAHLVTAHHHQRYAAGHTSTHPSWLTTSTYCVEQENPSEEAHLPLTPFHRTSAHSSTSSSTNSSRTGSGHLPLPPSALLLVESAEPRSYNSNRGGVGTVSNSSTSSSSPMPASRRPIPPPTPTMHLRPHTSLSSTLPPYVLKSKKLRRKNEQRRPSQSRGTARSNSFSATVEALANRAHRAQSFFNADLPSRPAEAHSFYISPLHQRVAQQASEAEPSPSTEGITGNFSLTTATTAGAGRSRKRRAASHEEEEKGEGDRESCSSCSCSSMRRRRRRRRVEGGESPLLETMAAPSLVPPPLLLPPSRGVLSERERQLELLFQSTTMEPGGGVEVGGVQVRLSPALICLNYCHFDMASSSTPGAGGGSGAEGPRRRQITKESITDCTYYEIFGLEAKAATIDETELRRRYRRYSLSFHPDKDPSAAARNAFETVNRALETLLDPALRQQYDALLRSSSSGGDGGPGGNSSCAADEATRRAAEGARFAEDLLRARAEEQRAAREATLRAAEEKAKAARQLAHELTHSADTPFREMERELVREWNIDEALLRQKETEVRSLLRQLHRFYAGEGEPKGDLDDAAEEKRKKIRQEFSPWRYYPLPDPRTGVNAVRRPPRRNYRGRYKNKGEEDRRWKASTLASLGSLCSSYQANKTLKREQQRRLTGCSIDDICILFFFCIDNHFIIIIIIIIISISSFILLLINVLYLFVFYFIFSLLFPFTYHTYAPYIQLLFVSADLVAAVSPPYTTIGLSFWISTK
eukprot:gene10575-7345_t